MPEYTKQRELQQERKEALVKAKQEQSAKIQESRQNAISEESVKLRESIPEWKDEKVMLDQAKSIHEYALTRFNQAELDHLNDHRFWLMMKDASELAKIKTKQIKEVRKIPTTVNSKRSPTTKKQVEKSAADIFYS